MEMQIILGGGVWTLRIDVQKGTLIFREFFDIKCVSYIQFTFIHCCYMVKVLNDSLCPLLLGFAFRF